MNTPWGKAQDKQEYAPGIVFYSTPSHGGFKISKAVQAVMPKHLQNPDGWYEEDCEWSKVALAFPHLFDEEKQALAQKTYEYWYVLLECKLCKRKDKDLNGDGHCMYCEKKYADAGDFLSDLRSGR
jgi:hypothetical protein